MLFARRGPSSSGPMDRSDAELLRLTREHADADAFGELYRRHQAALTEFLYHQTHDRDVAQDLVAETFAIAFSKVHRFDPNLGEGRQWLFGIARVALLARRREGGEERATRLRLEGEAVARDQLLDAAEMRIDSPDPAIVASLDQLSDPERDAVVSRVIEERDYVEIARRLSASEVAVRQRVSRGLRKLARAMSRQGE